MNSKVTLKFDVANSQLLTEEEKATIKDKLKTRMTADGVLMLVSQKERSQQGNKNVVLEKLDELLIKAFTKKKKRKATKPTKASKNERIKSKKQLSEKKKLRQKLL